MTQRSSLNKNIFELDINWINDVQINLSAVERRTSSLTKRRTVKKDFQVASVSIDDSEIRDQMGKALIRAKEDFK